MINLSTDDNCPRIVNMIIKEFGEISTCFKMEHEGNGGRNYTIHFASKNNCKMY